MSILSRFVDVVKGALGVPALIPLAVKRQVARLLTFGLKRLGLDVTGIVRQTGAIFDAPVARGIRGVIEGAARRMDLQSKVGSLADDIRFARNLMFETKFSNDRKYLYKSFVTIMDKNTGVARSKWISFYSDDSLTKDEIANWYEQNMLTEYHKAQYSLDAYNVFEVWHNQGKKY